jgi:predicted aspartyl protease
MSARWHLGAAIVAVLALVPVAGVGQSCKPLTRIVSLNTTDLSSQRITVPVSFGETTVPMLVDTGSPASSLDGELSQSLGFPRYRLPEGFWVGGEEIQYAARVSDMSLAGTKVEPAQFLVAPSPLGDEFKGLLGVDVLGHYDVELDFAAHALNLFLPNHCPGVVYWPASAASAVPFRVARAGYLVISVALEGKAIDAIVDTGSSDTSLTDTTAQALFGLTSDSPDMKKVGTPNSGPAYLHTFKTLDFNGIAIANIPVVVFHDVQAERMKQEVQTGSRLSAANIENGVTQLLLGMHELRKLHLYLAFGEGLMYATPPTPPPAGPTR